MQLDPIGAMNFFTNPNCDLCMQEHLTILKNLSDNHVTVMGPAVTKQLSIDFS